MRMFIFPRAAFIDHTWLGKHVFYLGDERLTTYCLELLLAQLNQRAILFKELLDRFEYLDSGNNEDRI